MKNVKKVLLLGIMLVNVMPCLIDGKIEWETRKIAAQGFDEEYYFGNCNIPFYYSSFLSVSPVEINYYQATCYHYVMATIVGSNPITYVNYCLQHFGERDPYRNQVIIMAKVYGISFLNVVNDYNSMLCSTLGGGKGVMCFLSNHVYLYYGFYKAGSGVTPANVSVSKYDILQTPWLSSCFASSCKLIDATVISH